MNAWYRFWENILETKRINERNEDEKNPSAHEITHKSF